MAVELVFTRVSLHICCLFFPNRERQVISPAIVVSNPRALRSRKVQHLGQFTPDISRLYIVRHVHTPNRPFAGIHGV